MVCDKERWRHTCYSNYDILCSPVAAQPRQQGLALPNYPLVFSNTLSCAQSSPYDVFIICCRGHNLLFADADGATTFSDLDKVERLLEEISKDGEGVVCGSRAHLEQDSIASRTAIRTFLMLGFHACVWLFAVKTVKDTQCGFKVSDNMIRRIFLTEISF